MQRYQIRLNWSLIVCIVVNNLIAQAVKYKRLIATACRVVKLQCRTVGLAYTGNIEHLIAARGADCFCAIGAVFNPPFLRAGVVPGVLPNDRAVAGAA